MITCELANRYTKAVEASTNSAAPRRIVLTGFMGSGKTTVGPLLAARLGWSFLDVDDVIEAEAGTTIAEIFARHGEAAFRKQEQETIARLAAGDSLVLALGGGAIEHEATRALLLTTPGTLLVHLEVELATTLTALPGNRADPPHPRRPGQPRRPLPAPPAALSHGPRLHPRRCASPGRGRGPHMSESGR